MALSKKILEYALRIFFTIVYAVCLYSFLHSAFNSDVNGGICLFLVVLSLIILDTLIAVMLELNKKACHTPGFFLDACNVLFTLVFWGLLLFEPAGTRLADKIVIGTILLLAGLTFLLALWLTHRNAPRVNDIIEKRLTEIMEAEVFISLVLGSLMSCLCGVLIAKKLDDEIGILTLLIVMFCSALLGMFAWRCLKTLSPEEAHFECLTQDTQETLISNGRIEVTIE